MTSFSHYSSLVQSSLLLGLDLSYKSIKAFVMLFTVYLWQISIWMFRTFSFHKFGSIKSQYEFPMYCLSQVSMEKFNLLWIPKMLSSYFRPNIAYPINDPVQPGHMDTRLNLWWGMMYFASQVFQNFSWKSYL
jgi:hypothetical protein